MNEIIKENISEIEVYDFKGENYKTAFRYGAWRIAYLNYGERFEEKNFTRIERHMLTDEIFMLLEGEATLVIGKKLEKVKMDQHKAYNIPKGVWHHIFTTPGTRVFIVENEETGIDNTEYFNVSDLK